MCLGGGGGGGGPSIKISYCHFLEHFMTRIHTFTILTPTVVYINPNYAEIKDLSPERPELSKALP